MTLAVAEALNPNRPKLTQTQNKSVRVSMSAYITL